MSLPWKRGNRLPRQGGFSDLARSGEDLQKPARMLETVVQNGQLGALVHDVPKLLNKMSDFTHKNWLMKSPGFVPQLQRRRPVAATALAARGGGRFPLIDQEIDATGSPPRTRPRYGFRG
jgi:hypothetical protein